MPDDTWVRFDDSKVEEAQPHLFNFFLLAVRKSCIKKRLLSRLLLKKPGFQRLTIINRMFALSSGKDKRNKTFQSLNAS